jgi:hypothetical protein
MRPRQVLVFLAGAAAVGSAGLLAVPGAPGAWAVAAAGPGAAFPPGAVRAGGSWGRAIEVPGLAALNKGRQAQVLSVSCASATNCAAGGNYRDDSGHSQAFVAGAKNGRVLNAGNNDPLAYTGSVSCASAGSCTVGGDFGWPYSAAFVASEKNGVWGQALNVPGVGALAVGR